VNLDRTFFITSVTWHRTPLFRSQPKAELMMDVLLRYREQMRYVLHEFVIMPDHLHLLLTPGADNSLESGPRALGGEAGDVSVFVGEREVWKKNVRKRNNERRKRCDLRQPFPEARLPNQFTPSGTTCKSVYLWKSGHSWPRCGNAKECRPLGPGACRAKAGR